MSNQLKVISHSVNHQDGGEPVLGHQLLVIRRPDNSAWRSGPWIYFGPFYNRISLLIGEGNIGGRNENTSESLVVLLV